VFIGGLLAFLYLLPGRVATGPVATATSAIASVTPDAREAVRIAPFRNCTEARAAGAAPVRFEDDGYGPHLDQDGDGVGCEPYRR
jgi:hypothetical protein